MASYKLNVNGKKYQVDDVDPATPVLWILRDHLELVGAKYSCGIAACGSCTIHLEGAAVRSCTLPVSRIGNRAITTIEGLAEDPQHPLLEAWREHDVIQCGYCQSGQIMTAAALLNQNPNPTDADIDRAMRGVLCRCGTYNRIRAAIKTAAKKG